MRQFAYQTTLDRYIAGADVPFTEVRKVWRNTTQTPCGTWAFFEQFFPLVRAINQKLRAEKRLRVLAGDPPIDWDQVKGPDDVMKFGSREPTIASVMVKEVLAKHRNALMLFGAFHIFHQVRSAVSTYEKDYPSVTFVISHLGTFDEDQPILSASPFASWPTPSLARAKGTWLGALDLSHFLPAPIRVDEHCNVHTEFPKPLQRPMEDLVDAFLYLGPGELEPERKNASRRRVGHRLYEGIGTARNALGISQLRSGHSAGFPPARGRESRKSLPCAS